MLLPINLTCYSIDLSIKLRIHSCFKNSQFHVKTHVYEQVAYEIIITITIHEFAIKSWHKTELQSYDSSNTINKK